MHISEAQHKTAGEFVDLVAGKLGSGRAVHPETAIAGAARLAGSLLFRSFDLNVPGARPGDVCLSNEANEEGARLVSVLATMLQHFGVPLRQEQLVGDASQRGGAPELSVVESLTLTQEEKWLRLFEQPSPIFKWTACGLLTVQSCSATNCETSQLSSSARDCGAASRAACWPGFTP